MTSPIDIFDGIREVALEGQSPRQIVPFDLTRKVEPVPIHVLHDAGKVYPLLSAVYKGATSIAVDVWLSNGKLLVGHDSSILVEYRTFEDIYVAPMLNLARFFNDPIKEDYSNWRGLFYMKPHTSFQVVINIRTDPEPTLKRLIEALEPLRQERFLSNYGKLSSRFADPSPFRHDFSVPGLAESVYTIIFQGGGTIRDIIERAAIRDYFYAETFENLLQPSKKTGLTHSPLLSPVTVGTIDEAITILKRSKHDDPRDVVKSIVTKAHSKGMRVIITDTQEWPRYARNERWKLLHSCKVDWLAAHDVEAALEF